MGRGGRHGATAAAALAAALAASGPSPAAAEEPAWRELAREVFVEHLVHEGCGECAVLLDASRPLKEAVSLRVSSQLFGCADMDVLLPSLHWLYEDLRRRRRGLLPGLLVDGGANVGRAAARWFAAMGDIFGRRAARNATQAPCIICAGAGATQGGGAEGAAAAPPTVAVAAVEPSPSNFALLRRHAEDGGWEYEGYVALQAALGSKSGEALLAVREDFAIDEIATLLFEKDDPRPRTRVRVVTLKDVVQAARDAFPDLDFDAAGIFLLKLDIEGLEPAVLRTVPELGVPVKFVTFEYADNVWPERLGGIIQELFAAGYFCFVITSERLFPISGPFWDPVYEIPMWSNIVCGEEADIDLESLVQLHSGAVGLWPFLRSAYLAGFASEDEGSQVPRPLDQAQELCTDLGEACAGVTCECPEGSCRPSILPGAPGPGPCTVRAGTGGARRSPSGEVSFLRDAAAGDLFLAYRRASRQRVVG